MEINHKLHKEGSGVARLNREAGNFEVRCGPATVSASALQTCHWGWQSISGKAQTHDDLEPGELPDHQSPFDPRAMGMGIPES